MDNMLSFLMRGKIEIVVFKDENLQIINDLFGILNNKQCIEQIEMKNDGKSYDLEYVNKYENTITVTPTPVMCLIMKYVLLLINGNDEIFSDMKQNQQAKEILLKLTRLIMNDADIKKFDNAPEIVSIFVNYLKQADRNTFGTSDGGELTDLLKTLKEDFSVFCAVLEVGKMSLKNFTLLIFQLAFLPHEPIKDEFIQQNGLELLMKFASKNGELYFGDREKEEDESEFKKFMADEVKITHETQQLALECFWSMSFNLEAAQLLKNNEKFMAHIKALLEPQNGTPPGLKKAADGVLWKLVKKNEFKQQQQRPQKEAFDLMISYNWDDM
ncbi:unnamed protein product [Didymodactylos carnosus]|uniref:Uncharacterized protein n=1 Tax=Didymodactylos carnosus TaxID=1234261 RepID=A0A814WF47_9BILA|nr:unnamed protein product [Didymodactylos carnosus]CAF3965874.1 unnamed protein product [Didymodactylos carnosus]